MTETEPAKDALAAESSKDEDTSEEEPVQVHSANAWEKADLGDEERNHKFLRLMGAAKKDHHGKVIIGDHNPEHPRKSKDTEEIEHKLQEQYEQSLQHRLAGGRRGRIGLGYHDADKGEHAKEEKDDDAKEENEHDDKKHDDKTDSKDKGDKPSRKRESEGGAKHKGESPEKKLKFAKSSS